MQTTKINLTEISKKVLERAENILGKEENNGCQHFLLFRQCFLNSLPNNKYSVPSKFKAFADNKINVFKKLKFALEKVENIVGKGEKCWLPAFSPIPRMFSEDDFLRVIKSSDCMVKS